MDMNANNTICILKSRRYPITWEKAGDGGSVNVLHIVEELLRQGFYVEVFTRREEGESPYYKHARLTVYRVPYAR